MSKYTFEDLVVEKDGMVKGPFGGDIKKSLFVPKDETTYKVYEQGVVYTKSMDTGNYYISKEYFEKKLKRFEVKAGDFLISGAGTLGEIFEVPDTFEKGIINQALIRVRVNTDRIDKDFFKYYFQHFIKKVACRLNGDSVIPNLPPLSVLKKIEVDLPDIQIQKKISYILLVFDKKIECNNKLISELESLAKTIYDYWFLQFEFLNEDGKPYKSSGGKMIWSEELKREIPEGWGVGELSDVSKIIMGSSPTGDTINEDKNGVVFYQGCSDFGYLFPSERTYTTKPLRFANEGDILFSVRAPVGDLNFALTKCCIGRGVAALSSDEIGYLFFLMKSLSSVFAQYNRGGTTFGDINKDSLSSIKIVIPPVKLRKSFEAYVKSSLNKMKICEEENRRLTELRDYLLPMLMNGQVGFANNTI